MHPAAGLEPIEGYCLVERLGAGGYGEVWKATAPGGLSKAVKIVFGSSEDARTQQELKSLTRIKDVRHPFLLSLDRFELVDNQLVIVMELAERSLLDRFEECRRSGLPGIPRRELLTYIQDAAEALDYMYENFGLLHLDIKPQNLLLVGGRAKIADFGLVKNLRIGGTITGGITPAYATPEAFDGKASPQSDQYSLAIVYQEMLTGERPFPGTTALQLTIQHINSPPLLDALPPTDRSAIAKALSKSPEDRFANCREMVAAIALGGSAAVHSPFVRIAEAETPSPVDRVEANDSPEWKTEAYYKHTEPLAADTPSEPISEAAPVVVVDDMQSPGRARPTMFVGIGGAAATTVRRVKQKMIDRFGFEDTQRAFRFLLLDTDKKTFRTPENSVSAEAFFGEEILPIPLRKAEDYRTQSKDLLRWLDRKWLFAIPKSQTTEGIRPFGRLALVDNAERVIERLQSMLAGFAESLAKVRESLFHGMPIDPGPIRVVVVSSMVGGAGSGSAADLGYALAQAARLAKSEIESTCMLAYFSSGKPAERELARTNALAMLTEIGHYLQEEFSYPGDVAFGLDSAPKGRRPFDEIYIHNLGENLDSEGIESGLTKLAEYLFLSAATPLGNLIHRYRRATKRVFPGLRTFRLSEIAVPRFRLAQITSEAFAAYLVEKWRTFPGTRDEAMIGSLVQAQATNFGFRPDDLVGRLEQSIQELFETDSRRRLNALLLERSPTETARAEKPEDETAAALLARVQEFLGTGKEPIIIQTAKRTHFEEEMLARAGRLSTELGKRAVDWVVRWVEDPHERLYVAEKIARELASHLGKLTDEARKALAILSDYRERMAAKFLEFDAATAKRKWPFKRKRKDLHAERMETLHEYFAVRLKEICLQCAEFVLAGISTAITDLTQDILTVRQRLSQYTGGARTALAGLFKGGWKSPKPPSLVGLIKGEPANIDNLAKTILESVLPEALFEFDALFQRKVLGPAGGLWQNVQRSELDASIRKALIAETRRAMLDAFGEIDAAQLFFQAHATPEAVTGELDRLLGRHDPIAGCDQPQLLIAAPTTAAGEKMLNEIRSRIGSSRNAAVSSNGDIIIVSEIAGLSTDAVARWLMSEPANYVEFGRKVLCRSDVAWAPLAVH